LYGIQEIKYECRIYQGKINQKECCACGLWRRFCGNITMVNVPVYSNENGLHLITIYIEDEDGTFRRTQDEPLRLLRDDIKGISPVQGDMVSRKYDRQTRQWGEPTVSFHYGRPQSYHQFLRKNLSRNKFYVFSKPSLSGRLSRFDLHELQLKTSISQRKISILKEKYSLSTGLWSTTEHEKKTLQTTHLEEQYLEGQSTYPQNIVPSNEAVNMVATNQIEADGRSNKETLDVDVEAFRDKPSEIQNRQPLKFKRNAHFLLRFLFDRE